MLASSFAAAVLAPGCMADFPASSARSGRAAGLHGRLASLIPASCCWQGRDAAAAAELGSGSVVPSATCLCGEGARPLLHGGRLLHPAAAQQQRAAATRAAAASQACQLGGCCTAVRQQQEQQHGAAACAMCTTRTRAPARDLTARSTLRAARSCTSVTPRARTHGTRAFAGPGRAVRVRGCCCEGRRTCTHVFTTSSTSMGWCTYEPSGLGRRLSSRASRSRTA
jgi:hypothetical protein